MNVANLQWVFWQQQYGIARFRLSFIMNPFRKPGFIAYDNYEFHVHSFLLNVVFHNHACS